MATERTTLVARLIRLTGDWDLAEDCVQDAVERALLRWPVEGLPRSPAAWLMTVAKNRALDVLRRRQSEQAKLQEKVLMDDGQDGIAPKAHEDDRLRLMFTCCHPALPLDGRVALTLKTVGGLSTEEIARAFLVSEATMSQRLLRTKRKISHAGIPYRVPAAELLGERTDGVLAVIYLIFNAGYGAREDHLGAEAIRLAGLMADLMPGEDEVRGLHALLRVQLARRATRFDVNGDLVPIEEQDRTAWDHASIAAASAQLRRASRTTAVPGPYRLQAQIAICHAIAPTAEATAWETVVRLYDALWAVQPSPVIALNRAIAVGFRDGFAAGLDALAALSGSGLETYYLYPAAQADFLRRSGRRDEARSAYEHALDLAPAESAEFRFLQGRLASS